MTDMKTTNQESANPPALIAWHVTSIEEREYWHRVGAAWDHKDGKGLTLVLEAVPIDGRVILREPRKTAAS